jgi:uncharacterized protein YcgI (DUF1989 family)
LSPKLYLDPDNPGPLAIDKAFYQRLAESTDRRTLVDQFVLPIRSGRAWPMRAGQLCRIVAVEGPQVCDLNLWSLHNPRERFWAARSRQLQGAHVTAYDRLWSCLPYLRPMLTFTNDTLPSEPTPSGGRVHDLLGTRCDPYVYKLIENRDFDLTCHNLLARAVAPYHLTEHDVHDVLNIFQVTGLDPLHEIYFFEPSPARKGDFLEFLAEIDLLCALSNCPSGDLSVWLDPIQGSDPLATNKPIGVEIYDIDPELLEGWQSPEPVRLGSVYEHISEPRP